MPQWGPQEDKLKMAHSWEQEKNPIDAKKGDVSFIHGNNLECANGLPCWPAGGISKARLTNTMEHNELLFPPSTLLLRTVATKYASCVENVNLGPEA